MLGLGLGVAGRGAGGLYDAEDLSKGTWRLDFGAFHEVTFSLNFAINDFRGWEPDPSWPYGPMGLFQNKG